MKELWVTNVGSHMWSMNRPESDTDLFIAYTEDIRTILTNSTYKKAWSEEKGNMDLTYHEIAQIVYYLKTGNVNFIWGVHSPIIVRDSVYLQQLRKMTAVPGANIYHSIHGLAVHNYNKYIKTGKDVSQKRLRTILRSIMFGITALEIHEYVFAPITTEVHKKDILDATYKLDVAYEETSLPYQPKWVNEIDRWLFDFRSTQVLEERGKR